MPSVAAQVLALLKTRLEAINGTGEYTFNLVNRVEARRPAVNIEAINAPRVFVYRRQSGEQREQRSNTVNQIRRTVIYDCVAYVTSDSDEAGINAEALLADIERALELKADLNLKNADGKNLLSEILQLVEVEIDTSAPVTGVEVIGVGVRCVWPHVYGDPSKVQP